MQYLRGFKLLYRVSLLFQLVATNQMEQAAINPDSIQRLILMARLETPRMRSRTMEGLQIFTWNLLPYVDDITIRNRSDISTYLLDEQEFLSFKKKTFRKTQMPLLYFCFIWIA